MANTSPVSGVPRKNPATVKKLEQLFEAVRFRAYQLYESRGRVDGRDLDDWLLAEREIIQDRRRQPA